MGCILMGMVTVGMDGPDEAGFSAMTTQGVYIDDSGTEYLINGTVGELSACASDLVRSPATALVNGVVTNMPMSANTLIMIKDPAANCVHNGGTLGTTMLVMICFSICVQMAEGLHFGIVPYISRPALGVVSGMVGAGGNAGALFAGKAVIGPSGQLDQGFINLGMVIIFGSLIMHGIFFPGEGGILLPKTFPY